MKTLLIVDLQNDFCENGALEVPEANSIVPVVNRLIYSFDNIIQTQDWHPEGHHSFASSHDSKEPDDTVEMDYGTQVLWPDHCVQGSEGAEFHPELNTLKTQVITRKGFRKEIDSYSAFYENDNDNSISKIELSNYEGIENLNKVNVKIFWKETGNIRSFNLVTLFDEGVDNEEDN